MPAEATVGELRYRIVIENYQEAKRQLQELGSISGGGGGGASQSGTSSTASGGPSSALQRTGGTVIAGPSSAGMARSGSGPAFQYSSAAFPGGGSPMPGASGPYYQYSRAAGPSFQYSSAAMPGGARGSTQLQNTHGPFYQYSTPAGPFYQYSAPAFPGGGTGQLTNDQYGPFYQYSSPAGPAMPTGWSAMKRNASIALGNIRGSFNTGGISMSLGGAVVGAAVAYAAVQSDDFVTRDRVRATEANIAGTRAGSISASYDRASNQYESFGLLGRAWGVAVNAENSVEGIFHKPWWEGPRELARGRARALASISAGDSVADSQLDYLASSQAYAAGSARNPENAAARDLIAAQRRRDSAVRSAGREADYVGARIQSGSITGEELRIAQNQYRALRTAQATAETNYQDESRAINENRWVYQRDQSNATRFNYGQTESMQTAAGGQRYSAAQSLLRAQQEAELRSFDTANSTAVMVPGVGMIPTLNRGARDQWDSIVARQAAERQLQQAERQHTLDVANLNLTTNERIQTSLRNRDPFGARAAAITGAAESDVQAYMYAQMPDQSRRAAKLGIGSLELERRTYLEGFRGVQYDVRNNPVDNVRDRENPVEVLKTIGAAIKELMAIVKALGSD